METDPTITAERIGKLSKGQLALLNAIIDTFGQPVTATRKEDSDIVSPEFLVVFGDILKLHHTMSDDYLDKYRFEAALDRVYKALDHKAERATRNAGYDLSVDGVKWSLKTQGDKGIKPGKLHISKYMELGKGKWETEADLPGLRDWFIAHTNGYERIFQLRYFELDSSELKPARHYYELVEIPKALLLEATTGKFEMMHRSTQNPKPGYCTVTGADGRIKFRLYFDGGGERKLQIKDLRKDLCIVHATWEF